MNAKQFFVKLFLFIAPILLLLVDIEYKLYYIPNVYNTKRAYLEKQMYSIEVLQLGTSHAAYGVDPACFSHKGFNLANISQDIEYDIALTLKYLGRLRNLKLVIINIDYTTFYTTLAKSIEYWRQYYYYRYWDQKYQGWSIFSIQNFSMISIYSPDEAQKIMLKGFKVNFAKKLMYNGCLKNDTLNDVENITDAAGKKRVQMHDSAISLCSRTNYVSICAEVDAFVKNLASRNVKVVFLTTPVYRTYSKFCNATIITRNDSVVNYFCKKYACIYYNYFVDERFTKADFADNDHLNYNGAKKFSHIMDDEIIKPILK